MPRKETVKIKVALAKDMIIAKYGSVKRFSEDCGIPQTSISRYVGHGEVPVPMFKLMCFSLGCKEEDLEEKVEKKSTVEKVFENEELKAEIANVNSKIDALNGDIVTLAKALADITKVLAETKAQTQLNAEELAGLHTKCSEINSSVSKIYGKIVYRRGYTAGKGYTQEG